MTDEGGFVVTGLRPNMPLRRSNRVRQTGRFAAATFSTIVAPRFRGQSLGLYIQDLPPGN